MGLSLFMFKADSNKLLQTVGVIVLIIFLTTIDFTILNSIFLRLDFNWVITFIFLWMFGLLIKGYIWQLILKKLKVINISLKDSLLSIIVGISSGTFLPGKMDAARPLILKSVYGIEYKKSLVALLMERFMLFISLIFSLLLFSTLVINELKFDSSSMLLLFFLFIFLTFFLLKFELVMQKIEQMLLISPLSLKWKNQITLFFEEIKLAIANIGERKSLVFLFILYLLTWLIEILRFYFVFEFVEIFIDFQILSFSYFASNLFSLIVPGGIGIFEYSQLTLISSMSENEDSAIGLAILIYRIIFYYSNVFIGALMLFFSKQIFKKS